MAYPHLTYEDVLAMDDATIINRFKVHEIGVIALHYVQEDRRTLGICNAAIRQNPRNARWVPKVLCTPEQLLEWVERDGWVFGYLEPDLRTVELAIAAVDFEPYIHDEKWVWMEHGQENMHGQQLHNAVAADIERKMREKRWVHRRHLLLMAKTLSGSFPLIAADGSLIPAVTAMRTVVGIVGIVRHVAAYL